MKPLNFCETYQLMECDLLNTIINEVSFRIRNQFYFENWGECQDLILNQISNLYIVYKLEMNSEI